MLKYSNVQTKYDDHSIRGMGSRGIVIAVLLCVTILSCSSDDSDDGSEDMESVDLTIVEGRYRGFWTWEIGDGPISMIITRGDNANTYKVDYFESNNYIPRRKLDGVSPDARGEMVINGTTISIDLDHIVDDPPCPGKFTGTGTINDMGEIDLSMNIDDCFAENEPATWKLTKREDL
ncbi:MAG: hypothetical protein ACFB0A_05025 [Croceivirga sp.]